jgi:hypothetical protein
MTGAKLLSQVVTEREERRAVSINLKHPLL